MRDPTGGQDGQRWRAMRHVDYQEWADEALGDRRQVYARSASLPDDAPLVFMPDGEAEQFRASARADELVCPVPGCPSPTLTTRGPAERRHHFVHRSAPADARHDLAYARRVTTRLLREWLTAQSAQVEIEQDVEIGPVPVTLLVRSRATGNRLAIIYVDQPLGAQAWTDDFHHLKAAEIPAAWIFGLRPTFFALPEPPAGAAAGDPVRRDRERGDLVQDRPIYRAMRSEGAWPLLISLERQELANLIRPGGKVAGPLGLQAPGSAERVLHLVPTALKDARLTPYGIATAAVSERLLSHAWRPRPLPTARATGLIAPPAAPAAPTRDWPPSAAYTPRPTPSPPPPAPPARPAPDPAHESRRAPLPPERVLAALPMSGGRTTHAALLRDLNAHDNDEAVKDALGALRAEGKVQFDLPLGLFSAIDVT